MTSIKAKKSLGQHFLHSKHVLDQILSAASPAKGDHIIEIGPGKGVLTEALLGKKLNVIAIEKDSRAFQYLQDKFEKEIRSGLFKLFYADILECNVEKLVSKQKFSIIANIPYYITGAILRKFLENEPRPEKMTLLVQKEVADRIVAKDGKESILSISIKVFGQPKYITRVSRAAFNPQPNVDSAILAINSISSKNFANKAEISSFFDILHAGFAHKRKFLIKNLETLFEPEKLNTVWKSLNFEEKIRAEDLQIEDWLRLFRYTCEKTEKIARGLAK